MFAYWYSADLMSDVPPGRVTVSLWHGSALRLENPVLIDTLTGSVLKPERPQQFAGYWRMPLPLTDYPLIVTDRAIAG
jgi:hypothetical protein